MSFLNEMKTKHEALKKRIHSFRLPLSPSGRFLMGVIYFSAPIIAGYYLMQHVNSVAEHNLAGLREKETVNSLTQAQNRSLEGLLIRHKTLRDDGANPQEGK